MKTIVVYTSQTGFTKRYAQWIAEKTQADIFDLREVQKKDIAFLETYDAIIYAGWCMAGKVIKSSWFFDRAANLKRKKLVLVAVGASPNENPELDAAMAALLTEEQKEYIKVFYCQGGINYDRMKLPFKLMMKMYSSALKKSNDKKQREQGEFISKSYDVCDFKFIEPIIAFLGE